MFIPQFVSFNQIFVIKLDSKRLASRVFLSFEYYFESSSSLDSKLDKIQLEKTRLGKAQFFWSFFKFYNFESSYALAYRSYKLDFITEIPLLILEGMYSSCLYKKCKLNKQSTREVIIKKGLAYFCPKWVHSKGVLIKVIKVINANIMPNTGIVACHS